MLATDQGTNGRAFGDSGDSGGRGDQETTSPLLAEEAAPGSDKELQHPTPLPQGTGGPVPLALKARKDPSCHQLRALSQVPLGYPYPQSPPATSQVPTAQRGGEGVFKANLHIQVTNRRACFLSFKRA